MRPCFCRFRGGYRREMGFRFHCSVLIRQYRRGFRLHDAWSFSVKKKMTFAHPVRAVRFSYRFFRNLLFSEAKNAVFIVVAISIFSQKSKNIVFLWRYFRVLSARKRSTDQQNLPIISMFISG